VICKEAQYGASMAEYNLSLSLSLSLHGFVESLEDIAAFEGYM